MSRIIEIKQGSYKIRGVETSMAGYRFKLVAPFKQGKFGGFVTVDGASIQPANSGIPARKIRINCDAKTSYVTAVGDAPKAPARDGSFEQMKVSDELVAHESDEEIVERMRSRFNILNDMTQAVKEGNVRAMIVTGPPGVGKSFGVEGVLNKNDMFNTLANRKPKYEVVKGAMSALGLYSKLYEFSDKGNVVVFDDCDSVLLDDIALNILKAALDSSTKRYISWNTDSSLLRKEGIPSRFEFSAGAIFITNIKFENVRSKKLQDHLAALESRCHYVDLQMDTDREKVLRIKQIVKDGMLDSYRFAEGVAEEIVAFIDDNRTRMRELSLRTVLKVADLRKSFEANWQKMAEVTVMKRGQ